MLSKFYQVNVQEAADVNGRAILEWTLKKIGIITSNGVDSSHNRDCECGKNVCVPWIMELFIYLYNYLS